MRLTFEHCVFDSGTREVFRDGRLRPISPKAFQLLEVLIGRRPNAVSKEELHQLLWPSTFVADANLPNLVAELRAALGDDARPPRLIRTVHRFGYAFPAVAERPQTSTARGSTGAAYRLLWGDREVALFDGENLIGRDQEAVVWLDDVSVSRHHARIVIGEAGARLEDLGSKNGTYVHGRKLEAAAPLHDGDPIRFGSVALVFRRFESGAATKTASSL